MSIRAFTPTILTALALASVACGSAQQPADNDAADERGTGSNHESRSTATSGGDTGSRGCDVGSIHFAFDSSELDSRARTTLDANARCIQQRPGNARVTGMADPRGTEEYNLALGDRRARASTQYMSNIGVDQSRMNVRSVGEEQASGRDETGWARDRRADIQVE